MGGINSMRLIHLAWNYRALNPRIRIRDTDDIS